MKIEAQPVENIWGNTMFYVDNAEVIVNDIGGPKDSKSRNLTSLNQTIAIWHKNQFRKNDNNYKVSLVPPTTYECQWFGEQEARVSAVTRALIQYKYIVLLV